MKPSKKEKNVSNSELTEEEFDLLFSDDDENKDID